MKTPKTTVVHVKDGFDVYIGRAMPGHVGSEFANDYRIGVDGTRDEVIAKHAADTHRKLQEDPAFAGRLERLRGKRLGCWCRPRCCHGDTYVRILEGEPPAPPVPPQLDLF